MGSAEIALRQQLLILHTAHPGPDSAVIAWALFDGATKPGDLPMQSGDEHEPPYPTVLDAMRDGWFVLQIPQLQRYEPGREYETGHLQNEFVLERKVAAEG